MTSNSAVDRAFPEGMFGDVGDRQPVLRGAAEGALYRPPLQRWRCITNAVKVTLQPAQPIDGTLPVDVGVVLGLLELRQRFTSGNVFGLSGCQDLLGTGDLVLLALYRGGPLDQGVDLRLVAPTEYVRAAVVDTSRAWSGRYGVWHVAVTGGAGAGPDREE